MLPADERFVSDHAPRFDAHDRLIEHTQLIAIDGVAQIGLEPQPRHSLVAHPVVEDLGARAALRLGAIHGRVGVAHDLLRVLVLRSRDGDADRRRREHFRLADLERRGDLVLNADRGARGVARVGDTFDEHGELVAAEACHRVRGAHGSRQPFADRHQQLVAGRVAERVVHVLEVIDVEEQHGERRAAVALHSIQGMLDAIEKQRAVRKSGERVVKRVVDQLPFGDALLGHVRSDAGRAEDASFRIAKYGVVPKNDATLAETRDDFRLVVRRDHAASDIAREIAAGRGTAILRNEQLEEVSADDFVLRVAGEREQIRIAVRDDADDVEQHRGELDGVEHLPESPVRFAQRLGRTAAFVRIDGHRHTRRAAGQPDVVAADLDGDERAVLARQIGGAVALRAARQQIGERHPQQFRPRVAVRADHRVVHGDQLVSVGVRDPHRIRISFEQQPELLLGIAQRRAGARAHVNLAENVADFRQDAEEHLVGFRVLGEEEFENRDRRVDADHRHRDCGDEARLIRGVRERQRQCGLQIGRVFGDAARQRAAADAGARRDRRHLHGELEILEASKVVDIPDVAEHDDVRRADGEIRVADRPAQMRADVIDRGLQRVVER